MTDNNTALGQQDIADQATSWFVKMRADTVTSDEQAAFQQWLAERAEHTRAYAEIAALWNDLGELPASSRLPQPPQYPSAPPPRRWPQRLAWLTLLMLVFGGLLWHSEFDRLRADYVTAPGVVESYRLTDGSVVTLNSDSALVLNYSPEWRRVQLLYGQAFFEVLGDDQRPFLVDANDIQIEVTGTQFDVRRDTVATTVLVTDGAVLVTMTDDRDQQLELGPGESARATGQTLQRVSADIDALTAWREGQLVFNNQPLAEVIAELDRHRPGRIVLLADALAQQRFSGVLSLADSEQALAALQQALPLQELRLTPYLVMFKASEE